MSRTSFAAFAILLCAFTLGCKPTSERMNEAAEHPTATAEQSGGVDVTENSAVAQTDNADQILQSCGPPSSDQVLPIYNKLNQGPIRRMTFHQRRLVTLEFIPSHPIERTSSNQKLTPQLPAGSVWRFDVAVVPKELDMITAARLKLFLPCASKALRNEF
jgi:hypothetical protein